MITYIAPTLSYDNVYKNNVYMYILHLIGYRYCLQTQLILIHTAHTHVRIHAAHKYLWDMHMFLCAHICWQHTTTVCFHGNSICTCMTYTYIYWRWPHKLNTNNKAWLCCQHGNHPWCHSLVRSPNSCGAIKTITYITHTIHSSFGALVAAHRYKPAMMLPWSKQQRSKIKQWQAVG